MQENDKKPKNADTLANTLADRIRQDAIEENLNEGDFFMTVDQVGDRYDVSRTIAREAVSQLRALGILKSRQRKGLLVGRPDPVALMERCMPFYGRAADGDAIKRLAELRYALETGAIELAINNAAQHQVEQLLQLADDLNVIAAAQGGFHVASRETYGHSMIVDPWGTKMAERERGNGCVVAEIDPEFQQTTRRNFPCLDHRRLHCR